MITVFQRVPDLFVSMYDAELQTWAREFRARGPKVAIQFRRPAGMPALLDAGGRPIMAGAWLEAEVDRSLPGSLRIVVRPASEHDAELIARHVREMSPHELQ